MFEVIQEMFSYAFMQRALVVGIIVSLCAAVLGVSLVMKRYSMIGEGLSSVGFASMGIAMALSIAPLYVAMPLVALAAFGLLRLKHNRYLQGDGAIAILSSSSMALGVVVISLNANRGVDISGYLFGSILSIKQTDVYLSLIVGLLVLVTFFFTYPKLFATTFDVNFSQAIGIKINEYNSLLGIMIALTITIGLKMMGAMLISSLLIFPALTAMQIFTSFRGVTLGGAFISVISFGVGLILSFSFSIPTGASVVLVSLVFFVLSFANRVLYQGKITSRKS